MGEVEVTQKEHEKVSFATKINLLIQLFTTAMAIGPALLVQANIIVLKTITSGFIRSQSLATVFLIDHKKIHEVAVLTVCLVKLGMVWLVRDIVVYAVEKLERQDAMSETTSELMTMEEFGVITEVNNDMVAQGHAAAGAKVTGALGVKVSNGAFQALKEHTGNFLQGMWPFHDKEKEGAGAGTGERPLKGQQKPLDEPGTQKGVETDVKDFLGQLGQQQTSKSKNT